ncbi:extracellular solute-binding protein [soil metagenome]
MRNNPRTGFLVLAATILAGCGESGPEGTTSSSGQGGCVIAYVALDETFSRPVLKQYEEEIGVEIVPKYDVESTKTVGLTNLILQEARRPRCDLFWNNEILNTLRLKRAGLLRPFQPAHADAIPDMYKAKDGTWYGFASRARVLIINTERMPDENDWPRSILDLTDPKYKGQFAIAKPLFGTTATHAACLFAEWGDEKARQYFLDVKANDPAILSGNMQVAIEVANGRLAFGMTDTDDVMVMLSQGSPVAMVYPDREPDQIGTLFIPNTIGLIKGSPHPEAAEALASHLLSPEVEAALAEGPGAQIPILETTEASAQVETPRTVHPMTVDFEAAAALWDEVAEFIASEFAS